MPVKQRATKSRRRPNLKSRAIVRKKLWIFDFDNTLVRLEPEVDWAAGRRELEPMLRAAGVPEDLFEKIPKGNLPLYSATRARLLELIASGGTDFTKARVRRILRDASKMIERYEMAGVDRAAPLEGAIEMLHQFVQNRAHLAIVTSNSSRTIRRWLSLHHLGDIIEVVVGRDSLLALKPSPEMLDRALSGLAPSDAAFVGDADSDYYAANAVGVEFFGIASTQKSRDALAAAGATRIFSSPAALAIHLNLVHR